MKRRFMVAPFLIYAVAILVAPSAAAEDRGAKFRQIDLNNDGYIDESENRTALRNRAETMDANHDGKVTLDEYESWLAKDFSSKAGGKSAAPKVIGSLARCFILNVLGKDGDSFTIEQYIAYEEKFFRAQDLDHDGRVSLEEFKQPPRPGVVPMRACNG